MTTAMLAAARKNNGQSRQSDLQQDKEQDLRPEILPDTVAEILRRMQEEFKCPICLATMQQPVSTGCNHTFCRQCVLRALDLTGGCPLCKAHVTKRSLNTVGHLEQLIDAFLQLKEAFELELGSSLSQAPWQYIAVAKDNLTQYFPYPEKCDEPSKDTPGIQQPPSPSNSRVINVGDSRTSTIPDNHKAARGVDTQPSVAQQDESANTLSKGIDCFDVNLDTLSEPQAAALAEKMMSMMSLVPMSEAPLPLSLPLHPKHPPDLLLSRDTQLELPGVQEENERDNKESTRAPVNQSYSVEGNEDPKRVAPHPWDELSQSCIPTQERPSEATDLILCATAMSSLKKHQLENVSKALRAKTIDDFVTEPTHVILDLRITASMNAGYWVDELPYQINDNEFGCNAPKMSRARKLRGERPLFSGCEVQLFGTFSRPTKEELELMIETGGGIIVSELFLRSTQSTATHHRHHHRSDNIESAEPRRHILLYDQASEGVMSLRKMKTKVHSVRKVAQSLGKRVEVVHYKVLLDCIASYDIGVLSETDLFVDT
ncbi:Breast cancer 1, early onset [Modicella reniformis]|uniref:Breast cancer 1, early onset n=1 Tax=Modicella reniformis TaxID=1440133 RepID=A0A9P6MLY1_9FUNG|nr:Breast cancer 1, early onset [Modicella reniformis]